jgi:Zn-finger nucleic acid-binding protein
MAHLIREGVEQDYIRNCAEIWLDRFRKNMKLLILDLNPRHAE